jgi:peptidylprolyl isomerase
VIGAALAALALGGLAACSSSGVKASAAPSPRPVKHVAVDLGGCIMSVSTDLSTKPAVSVPASPACTTPPTKLAIADAIGGSGPAAQAGDSVKVKYVGLHWTTRAQFDASWDNGSPDGIDVSPLGHASVITGWNEGLVGAHVGDRRILAIPPALAYGPAGSGTAIGPNEALIFIVDVVSITPSPSASPS